MGATGADGPVGPVGPVGPQGPTGPQGAQGPASGIIASVDMSFSVDDRSGWTHVEALGDDTCTTSIPLGFTYNGFGTSTAVVSISSNGVLFIGNNCSSALANQDLPAGISNDPLLAFFWDDLNDYGSGEYLEYKTNGTGTGQVFNLFFTMRLFSSFCGSDHITVMLSVHQQSRLVKARYSGLSGCNLLRGDSATLGMQTANAATAFTVGVNSPVLDDNQLTQTMTFHPPN